MKRSNSERQIEAQFSFMVTGMLASNKLTQLLFVKNSCTKFAAKDASSVLHLHNSISNTVLLERCISLLWIRIQKPPLATAPILL